MMESLLEQIRAAQAKVKEWPDWMQSLAYFSTTDTISQTFVAKFPNEKT